MDKNKKKADEFIGEVVVSLNVGSGRKKVEVPSRCVSSLRPFVFFRYDVTPQMFFEQVEYVRVTADEAEAAEAAKGEPPDTDGESDGDADKDE